METDNGINDEVILRLEAFARSLLKVQPWFRGGNSNIFLKGKEMRDYVYEGIEKYLRNPKNYDPTKGDLVAYLKWNIIRSLVSNDVTSKENRVTKDVFAYQDDEDSELNYLDRILPCLEPMFEDELDYTKIKEYVEKRLEGDSIAEEIFLGIYSNGMKRNEIIKEFNMSENDYNNGVRRLNTVLSEASVIFKSNPAKA